ncbi:hypothetical protein HYU22_04525, partial [Candidatus Woesearchaeota archaeon]|nr:hypothetical protein [Candidatus Woesearchaeota archaeon]
GPSCPSGTEDTNNDGVCGRVNGVVCTGNVQCESGVCDLDIFVCVATPGAPPPTCDAEHPSLCGSQSSCLAVPGLKWVPVLPGGPAYGCYASCPSTTIDFTNDGVCKLAQGQTCTAAAPGYCESGICTAALTCAGACTNDNLPSACNTQSTCVAVGFLWSLGSPLGCVSGPSCPSGTEDTNNDGVCGRESVVG